MFSVERSSPDIFSNLAAFIHRGNGRSGGRAKMLNVGLHGRTSSAAALMAA
jgi:hypothetical protein